VSIFFNYRRSVIFHTRYLSLWTHTKESISSHHLLYRDNFHGVCIRALRRSNRTVPLFKYSNVTTAPLTQCYFTPSHQATPPSLQFRHPFLLHLQKVCSVCISSTLNSLHLTSSKCEHSPSRTPGKKGLSASNQKTHLVLKRFLEIILREGFYFCFFLRGILPKR